MATAEQPFLPDGSKVVPWVHDLHGHNWQLKPRAPSRHGCRQGHAHDAGQLQCSSGIARDVLPAPRSSC
eukprot:4561949-Amphidinium_carterae.1